jgi:HK97 family phage major capsid protein
VPTIEQFRVAAEARRRAAENRTTDAKAALARYVAAAEASGREDFPTGNKLAADWRSAQDEQRLAEGALAEARRISGEEDETSRLQAESHPTGLALYGAGSYSQSVGGAARGDRDDRARWVREDGRPAVVERGQRFADHPVISEQISRAAGRDEAIVGQHGGIGHLIRSMSTTSGSAVVPSIWASNVIDRARNLAAVMKAGAVLVPMSAKIENIGRLAADPSSGFRAEGSTITASDPTFDNVTLTATTLSALVIGSLEWFQDVTPGGGADQLVTEALAKVLALQIDLVSLFGGVVAGAETTATGNNMLATGVGLPNLPNPRGILAALLAVAPSSVLGSGTNGTVQTAATFYKEVIDTIYTPRDFNEAPNALLWPSHLARIYAEAVNTLNDPMRVPADVDAIPKFMTNQIPSGFTQGTGTLMSDLFVGNFEQLLIGQRLELQIQTLTERYAELGQVGILATWRGDVQLARPRAFAVYRYLQGR